MQRKHNTKNVPIAKMLRKNMTPEERHLWYDFLREYRVRFSRQKVLGKYIVDFYSAEARLVIELDGSGHDRKETQCYDYERTLFLEQYGLQVIRIPNEDVRERFYDVCEYIDRLVEQSLSQLALTAPFTQGSLQSSLAEAGDCSLNCDVGKGEEI